MLLPSLILNAVLQTRCSLPQIHYKAATIEKQSKIKTLHLPGEVKSISNVFFFFCFCVDNQHQRVSTHNRTTGYCQAMVKRRKANVRLHCSPVYCAREGKNESGDGNYHRFHKRWTTGSLNYGKIQLKYSN